ncbi:MAG: Helix-turn-helix domain protein [Chloroflexi bacterium ADurb.Bin180]|jgi:excisionase family DNA binding protein|nr:MAG: Helix-turn-helix domain protein [Chloroflexi bacterium ADurb.Bin180]
MRIDREALYTMDEIAEMFGIGKRTAQRMVYSGKVPARKLANKLVVRGADLLDGLPSYSPRGKGTVRSKTKQVVAAD